jgi:hypothetical protein
LEEVVVKSNPNDAQARSEFAASCNDLASTLATTNADRLRNGKRAVELATRACELSEWKDPDFLDTLASAYAEIGNFGEAVKWQQDAIRKVRENSPSDLEEYLDRLMLYESGKPFREPMPDLPARVFAM